LCGDLAKTNLDEFANGLVDESSFYGSYAQTWARARYPAVPSGGLWRLLVAAAVRWQHGDRTGGRSVSRLDSPMTGIKAAYGRVSRGGIEFAYASVCDQGGREHRNRRRLRALMHMCGC